MGEEGVPMAKPQLFSNDIVNYCYVCTMGTTQLRYINFQCDLFCVPSQKWKTRGQNNSYHNLGVLMSNLFFLQRSSIKNIFEEGRYGILKRIGLFF